MWISYSLSNRQFSCSLTLNAPSTRSGLPPNIHGGLPNGDLPSASDWKLRMKYVNMHGEYVKGEFLTRFTNPQPWEISEGLELLLNYLEMHCWLSNWDCIPKAIYVQSAWMFLDILCFAQRLHAPFGIMIYWVQTFVLRVISFCKNQVHLVNISKWVDFSWACS